VLVHCMAGVSRSVTVTIAYLMKCCHMTLADACKLLRKTRKQSHPNMGFFQSLVELEQELKYNNTMNHYR
jgi:protein-tyrosine phosphatase